MQIAKIIGIKEGYLRVRSLEPKEDFKIGGPQESYQYEWYVNHYSFTADVEETCEKLGLTIEEYNRLSNKITE